jgi:four helix bundle protein
MKDIRERTFDFALRVIKLCQQLEEEGGVGRTLGWQLLRSGTSIGANVEEAQASQSKLDFISKNAIALKEARETIYWLRLVGASNAIRKDRLSSLPGEADELARIIGAIIVSAKKGKK